ncbi:hypothetical protein GOP47_0002010 [Adiantum capillus-veneris]|uniref:HYDIN/VesB/CFA65-like Ig-like domain-containing protein n=1 Tax=Adiantum capillus-veneris TaxID=13818 RepID=A0A9D4ZQP9_ADICA|nr:hypothetical protein GOP47_0002010 [Adiantum capillus-veneris]
MNVQVQLFTPYSSPLILWYEIQKPGGDVKEMITRPHLHIDGQNQSRSCIIEQHNLTDQAYQLVSSVPEEEPLFQPFPQEVIFSGYDPFRKYTAVLQLRNNDKAMRRVQVLTVDPETITVHQPYDQGNEMFVGMGTNKVACGMKVTYIVTFCPESDEDYQSELVVVTDREKFIVPVKCFGRKPVLSVPDEVVFPPTPVKCLSKKNFIIQNVGTKNCTFNITASGAFSVRPTDGYIDKGCFTVCELTFEPVEARSHEEDLKIFYTQCNQCIISKVLGAGCELNIGLSMGLASMPVTFIGKSISANVQLINESSSVVQFVWPEFHDKCKKKEIKDATFNFVASKDYYQRELQIAGGDSFEEASSKVMLEAFSLTPSKGELWPGTILDITVTFSPPKALRYIHTAYCVVSGKSDPLKLEMQGSGIGPQVQLYPDVQDLGNIHLYSTYRFTVELHNTGELEAVYRLMSPLSSEIINFTFNPSSGALPPMEVETIFVEAVCNAMGKFDEKFLWEVDGVLQNLSLKFHGNVGPPEFHLNAKVVDFGDVSYGVGCVKQIELHNASPSPLLFIFQIHKEEDDTSLYSANPESCLIQPEEIKAVDLCIIAMEEKKISAALLLNLEGVGDAIDVIPLHAECFSPQVSLSLETLDYGSCLLRYSYTQEIEIINNSNVPAWYEIVSLSNEDKLSAVMEADAASGTVSCHCQKPVKLSLQTQKLGQISLLVTVNVSGKESKPLTFAISAISCGPSIQIEQPASDTSGTLTWPGENTSILDFGKVQVLQYHACILMLKNLSCIPAELKISLSKKKTVFCIEMDTLVLEPFGSQKLTVTANLDDSVKFTDSLKIITEGSQHLIPLKAVGIGSTLVCTELATGAFDFGKQVTLRPFSYTLNIENQGRKQQSLAWVSMSAAGVLEKGKEKEKRTSNVVAMERKKVFSIAPEKAIIKPHATCQFTLTGYALDAENVIERLRCNVTTTKAVWSHDLFLKADISPLKLLLSSKELFFVQNNSLPDDLQDLSQTLTCKNVSELPIHFELSTKEPFFMNHSECRLQPSESVDIIVNFERQHSEERLSKSLQGNLEIVYTGTNEREALKLQAEVYYPNLQFDVAQLNFGCVIENTLKRLHLNIQNVSRLSANYHWFLIDDSYDIGNTTSIPPIPDRRVSASQLFDILPIRGYLEPGEEEKVEISFNAYPGYECHTRAICEVEGGPQYSIVLEAETGLLSYSLSETSLDFGFQQFNQTAEKYLSLLNSGKIPINFTVGFPCRRQTPFLNVSPLHGTLDPGHNQNFTVSICPLLPERYQTLLTVQVSHFLPYNIHVFGEGVFPHVFVDLPRIRNHKFLTKAKEALANLSRDRITISQPDSHVTVKGDNLGDPQVSSDVVSMAYKIPTIEEIDAEIDRLLLVQSLTVVNDQQNFASEQYQSTELPTGNETTSERLIKDLEKYTINRYLCDFGNVILGESHQKSFSISNAGVLPVSIKGEKTYLKGTGFFFEPEQQLKLSVTSSSKMVEFNLMLKTDSPKFSSGIIEATIPLCIKEAPRTMLLLRANVTKPLLELSTEWLDFDSILFGQCKSIYVQLHNNGKVPCAWEILKPEPNISDFASIRDFAAFRCIPSLGTVLPNECFNLEVRFMPVHRLHSYFVKLPMKILHSSSLRYISCKGHSYNLPFSIEPTEVQLAPIIPKGMPPAQCTMDLVNSSDQLIEVYSLDYDAQYIEEENILRENKTFNEEGFFLLPPRQAGQPFWKELMPTETQTTNPPQRQAPRDSWKAAKEKILPSKKGASAKKPKDEPVENFITELPVLELDTPIFILHGPPLSGKTTQGNLLSLKFNLPVIDVRQVVPGIFVNAQGDGEENDRLQDVGTLMQDFTLHERELIDKIRQRLKQADCNHGVIFDGLHTQFLNSAAIARCILLSVGLQSSVAPLQTDITSSTQTGEQQGIRVWVGNPLVYVLIINFEQDSLAYRYAQIPDIDHAKEKHNSVLDKAPDLSTYPFLTRFPSQEVLDLFFRSEPVLYNLLHGQKGDSLENDVQNKVRICWINGMQEINEVFEDELRVLPSPGVSTQIPMPCTYQVIKRPPVRPSCPEFLSHNFSILTPVSKQEVDIASSKKGKDGGKNTGRLANPAEKARIKGQMHTDQLSDAGSILDDKVSVSTKTVGTKKSSGRKDSPVILSADASQDSSALSIIPEGLTKQSRWIIPPHSKMSLLLRFWAIEEQDFDHTFLFQMVNAPGKASFRCRAKCARPHISCELKKISLPSILHPSFSQNQILSFRKDQMLDFGAIPAGVNPEGFPGIQDSEHSIRLTIHNTGLFDLHVDFDILSNLPSATSQKSSKQPTFFLHPPSMDLKIEEKQDLRIYCYPKQDQLGILEGKLVCKVTDNPEHVQFKLRCLSDVPRANLDPSSLNFERLQVGLLEKKDITIRNTCSLPIHWRFIGLENSATEFAFSETHGVLGAMCTNSVHISFSSILEKILKEHFRLQVFYAKTLDKPAQEFLLAVTAEAYKIDIVVKNENCHEDPNTLDFGILRVAEELLKTLTLQNKGKYPVLFNFCMKRSFSEIFTITPLQGKLEPKEEQKVEVHFNKERRLTKEISFQRVQDFQLCITESHVKKSEQKIVIPVSIKAAYSKFVLAPEHGIHFGSQVCGTTSISHVLTILNVGDSSFNFKLSAEADLEAGEPFVVSSSKQENAPKKESEKAVEGGKGGDSKKGAGGKSKKAPERRPSSAKPETLELKYFTLSPQSGTIHPNEKREVMVCFKAEALGSLSENVRVRISDCDPLLYPQDPVYTVSGDSCMPGIDVGLETIFEEHHVVSSNNNEKIPPKGTFSRKENVFSFGPVVLAAPASKSTGQKPAGQIVEAKLRIENPYKVPCSLEFLISSSSQQVQDSSCFSVSPKTGEIPPLEYMFVTCSFLPATMKIYSSTLDIMLMIKGQAQTSLFKCELTGEGTLPSLSIECPTLLSPFKTPWLKFPRLLKGKSRVLPIVLQNKGLVTVTGKMKIQGKDVSWISFASVQGDLQTALSFESSFSIPSGDSQKIMANFSPIEAKAYKEELVFFIDDNPSVKPTIQITGECYDEDIVFLGLPMDSDNELYFEDCPLESERSLEFSLQNKAEDRHFRFEWPNVECLTFSPGSGYLLGGQVQSIHATFSPSKAMQYVDHEIKLQVCNIHYKGEPETDQVALSQQQGAPVSKQVEKKPNVQPGGGAKEPTYEVVKGRNKVIIAKLRAIADTVRYECFVQEINFKTTMMFQKRAFSFLLKNVSSIAMSFTWMVQGVDGSTPQQEMYVVSPVTASLQAKESVQITVRFCPMEVEDCNHTLICDIPNLDPSSPPLKIALKGKVARPWCYFELLGSGYACRRQDSEQGVVDPQTNVIEFDSLGSNMHGIKYFVATNPTSKPYKFIWEQKVAQKQDHLAEVVPSAAKLNTAEEPFKCLTITGEIMGGRKYEMAFQYNLPRVEHHESLWNFKIPEQKIEVPFLLVSNIKKPALKLDKSVINFGQVLVGSRVNHTVYLRNEEAMPFFFCFARRSYTGMQHESQSAIRIKPRSAIVKPASILPIEVSFAPLTEGRVNVKARCNLKRFNPLFISIKGEAYQYHEEVYMDAEDNGAPIKLSCKEINCIKVRQVETDHKKFMKRLTITNLGKVAFQFLWEWSQDAPVVVEPAGGIVGKGETVPCELSISVTKVDEGLDTDLSCQVMHGKTYQLHISASQPEDEDGKRQRQSDSSAAR